MLKDRIKITNSVRNERGFSLVEVIIILVIIGIAAIPLSRLSVRNMVFSGRYATMTKAISYAQERLEQVIADYAASSAGRGYDWVRSNWAGSSDTPLTGFTRSVSISSQQTLNGVTYVVVTVSVSAPDINNVVLTTWLVDND